MPAAQRVSFHIPPSWALLLLLLLLGYVGVVDSFVLFPAKVLVRKPEAKGAYLSTLISEKNAVAGDSYWEEEDAEEEEAVPGPDLKESFYTTLDALQGRFDKAERAPENYGGTYEKALKAKETVYDTIEFLAGLPALPGKAWSQYVTRPLQIRREKAQRNKEQRRRLLERTLERYNSAKNRFYDTLDVISDTTKASVNVVKTSVKAVKTVGKAVAEAPERVTEKVNQAQSAYKNAVETVKDTKEKVEAFPGKVTNVVQSQIKTMENIRDSCVSTVNKVKTLIPKKSPPPAPAAPKTPPPVEEIWEPTKAKKEEAVAQPIVTLNNPPAAAPAAPAPAAETVEVEDPVEQPIPDSLSATVSTRVTMQDVEIPWEVVLSAPEPEVATKAPTMAVEEVAEASKEAPPAVSSIYETVTPVDAKKEEEAPASEDKKE